MTLSIGSENSQKWSLLVKQGQGCPQHSGPSPGVEACISHFCLPTQEKGPTSANARTGGGSASSGLGDCCDFNGVCHLMSESCLWVDVISLYRGSGVGCPLWEDGTLSCHQSSPRSSHPILHLLVPALGTHSGMPGTPFAAAWAVGSDAPTAAWCHCIALFCPRPVLLPSHLASCPRLYLGLSGVSATQRASPSSRVVKAHWLSSEIHGKNMVPSSSGGFGQL